jgi:hypothetical protein
VQLEAGHAGHLHIGDEADHPMPRQCSQDGSSSLIDPRPKGLMQRSQATLAPAEVQMKMTRLMVGFNYTRVSLTPA